MLRERFQQHILAASVALGSLIVAQSFLEDHVWSWLIGLTIFASIGVWSWCVWLQPPRSDQSLVADIEAVSLHDWQYVLVGASSLLAALAWLLIDGNRFTLAIVMAWLGAVALWLLAWLPGSTPLKQSPDRSTRRWTLVLLAVITLLGAGLRFYDLDSMPYDMTQDHSWKLLDIDTILRGEYRIFFPNNTGREPWQFYYIATLIRVFNIPHEFIALKIGNAIIGTLTVPLMFLFGREVGGRKLGLATAGLYAVAKWPLATTRMGLRFPYATLPATLVFIYLWRYMRLGRRNDAVMAGFWMGFGLYGYIGIRVMPLVIALVLIGMIWYRKRQAQPVVPLLQHAGLLIVTMILVFLPLEHFMVQYPEVFWYRAASRSANVEQSIEATACQSTPFSQPQNTLDGLLCRAWILGYNTIRAAGAFNWEGDRSQVNHVTFDPFFDRVTGALFLAGLPIVGWYLFKQRSLRWWMLVLALPILFLTSTLSLAFPLENPSTSRTGVVMPVVFTLAATPIMLFIEWCMHYYPFIRWAEVQRWRIVFVLAMLAPLALGAVQQNSVRYFRDLRAQYRFFVPNTGEIAAVLERYPDITLHETYLLTWPYWMESRALSIHLGDIYWHERHAIDPDIDLLPLNDQPRLYILNINDAARQSQLRTRYPQGRLELIETELRHQRFMTFYIPGN